MYENFLGVVIQEIGKQGALHKVFRIFYEYMEFKSKDDLYGALFLWVDKTNDKKFSRDQLL